MKYKKIIYVLLFWFAFYAILEIIMNLFFNEHIVLWKTLAISFITAICTCYVLFKKNRNVDLKDLLAYQEKEIPIPNAVDDDFNGRLSQSLAENGFILLDGANQKEIRFKTKTSFNSFGEIYKVSILDNFILLNSRPKLFTNFISEDAKVADRINKIAHLISQNYR